MTTAELTQLFTALYQGANPLTGEEASKESYLRNTTFRNSIHRIIRELRAGDYLNEQIDPAEIVDWKKELVGLGFQVSTVQLAKVLTASRSIVAPELIGLPWYGKFKGVFTRRALTARLSTYEQRNPGTFNANPTSLGGPAPAWKEVRFFDDASFDKLADEKATDLFRAVESLGIIKKTDLLPEYIVRSRKSYPRSFEPWRQEEKALLIEAMCYTNELAKLAHVFGRSAKSIRSMGQRLIWDSQQRAA